jgi:hypothetical protein
MGNAKSGVAGLIATAGGVASTNRGPYSRGGADDRLAESRRSPDLDGGGQSPGEQRARFGGYPCGRRVQRHHYQLSSPTLYPLRRRTLTGGPASPSPTMRLSIFRVIPSLSVTPIPASNPFRAVTGGPRSDYSSKPGSVRAAGHACHQTSAFRRPMQWPIRRCSTANRFNCSLSKLRRSLSERLPAAGRHPALKHEQLRSRREHQAIRFLKEATGISGLQFQSRLDQLGSREPD